MNETREDIGYGNQPAKIYTMSIPHRTGSLPKGKVRLKFPGGKTYIYEDKFAEPLLKSKAAVLDKNQSWM